jgi:hypothetical protein
MTKCSICNFPTKRRAAVDEALRANVSLGKIAEASGASKSALSRHSAHVEGREVASVPQAVEKHPERTTEASVAKSVAVSDRFQGPTKEQLVARIEHLWTESVNGLEAAKQPIKVRRPDGAELELPGDLRARAAFLREGRGVLELAGVATAAWGPGAGQLPAEINLALIVQIPRSAPVPPPAGAVVDLLPATEREER